MKNKKRKSVGVSLLLISALCMPSGVAVQANEKTINLEAEFSEETVSINDIASSEKNESEIEKISTNIVIDQNEKTLSENESETEKDSENLTVSQNKKTLSENESETEISFSDNKLPSDTLSQHTLTISENSSISNNEEILKKPLNVVLPTEIPFNIILLGQKGLEGIVSSEQFCIENRGYMDVSISLQGICIGENKEDYVINDAFTENKIVPGKKNAWIYLKWEDANRKVLDLPKIVMGDTFNPGEAEITLKAPTRDAQGKITGQNSSSRAYFSFTGALKSDTDEAWKAAELKINLDFSIKPINSTESITPTEESFANKNEDESKLPDESLSLNQSGNSVDDIYESYIEETVSNNIDKSEDIQSSQISKNDAPALNDIDISSNSINSIDAE